MQKTRFGIAVGLMGAIIYFLGITGGYIPTVIAAGAILLTEENEWLKKSAVKCVLLMLCFSLVNIVIGFIPDVINIIDRICTIFDGSFSVPVLTNIVYAATNIINLIQYVLFILLGLKAFNQGTIPVGFVDSIVNKYV